MRINYLMYKMLWYDGYGRYGLQQMQALARLGVEVYPETVASLEAPGWVQRLRGFDWTKLTISLMPPHELRAGPGRQWNYTMYEGTGLPDGWGEHINRKAERLLVPSEWLVDVFRQHGVKKSIPIHVVPGGVDVQEFPVIAVPAPEHRPYTFLAFGDRGTRKGMDAAWVAFYQAFGDDPDVRLVIKGRPTSLAPFNLAISDRRVSLWAEDVPSLREVFSQVDCFVFPTKGEGWGMPPREAAAMGLPVICTQWGGTADCEHWAIPIRNCPMKPASLKGGGEWAFPDIDEIAAHMRWCYENRAEARQRGLEGAYWLRAHQTWEHSAQALMQLIEEWG